MNYILIFIALLFLSFLSLIFAILFSRSTYRKNHPEEEMKDMEAEYNALNGLDKRL